jgi:hypothetical protein
VLQLRNYACFLLEAAGEGSVVKKMRWQDLQRDSAIELRIVRLVYARHAASPKQRNEAERAKDQTGS